MSFKTKNVRLVTVGEREFKLLDDLIYTGKCGDHTVDAGFVTDFASVPQVVTWLIPSYGKYTLAAIVHDYLCVQLGDYYHDSRNPHYTEPSGPPSVNSRDTDGIFRRIMRELEVPFIRRWLMWTGVRWGALFNPARRKGIAKDLPLMLLWSTLALPVVLPASLFVGAGLLVDKVFESMAGRFLK